jgi:hypothetical protein
LGWGLDWWLGLRGGRVKDIDNNQLLLPFGSQKMTNLDDNSQKITSKNNNTRRLIYVDASGIDNNSVFKISLYDKSKKTFRILELKNMQNNTEAEQYAIFYAIFYIKKYNYERCHILCDNESAVNSKIVQFLSKDYNIGISWIPREANLIADKISRLEPTLNEYEWNLLELFIELVKKQCHNIEDSHKAKDEEIVKLKESIETRNTKIKNQANQIKILREKLK